MPQSSDSICASAKRTKRIFLCKAAFFTIPRYGISALVMLLLGIYFFFPAMRNWKVLSGEKQAPYVLSTAFLENVDFAQLQRMEGIAEITPVLSFEATLSYGDFQLSCPVEAVYSSFLTDAFLEGNTFPDATNMPFVVLNPAAAEGFQNEDAQKTKLSVPVSIRMKAFDTEGNAAVCGIYEENSETPRAYMSYDTAKNIVSHAEETTLKMRLTHAGDGPAVCKALRRLGFTIHFDRETIARWESLEQQIATSCLAGLAFLLCFLLLTREKSHSTAEARSKESQILLLTGLSEGEIRKISYLRLAFTILIGIVTAVSGWLLVGIF